MKMIVNLISPFADSGSALEIEAKPINKSQNTWYLEGKQSQFLFTEALKMAAVQKESKTGLEVVPISIQEGQKFYALFDAGIGEKISSQATLIPAKYMLKTFVPQPLNIAQCFARYLNAWENLNQALFEQLTQLEVQMLKRMEIDSFHGNKNYSIDYPNVYESNKPFLSTLQFEDNSILILEGSLTKVEHPHDLVQTLLSEFQNICSSYETTMEQLKNAIPCGNA